jgi:UDP:flavonoid glycosyltransferase YjiC (YdhE family)
VALDRPSGERPTPVEVVRPLVASIREVDAEIVVGDGLTLTPGLAAEVAGVPRATLFPAVYPANGPGLPPFSLGMVAPRTALGAAVWRFGEPLLAHRLPSTRWLRGSQRELAAIRAELGLAPREEWRAPGVGGLTLVATFPQLEYPRRWPPLVEVTGPMFFDQPHPQVHPPPGDGPLIVVAPSTVKDPRGDLVRTSLEALADEPVRLVVTTSGTTPPAGPIPANAVVADWVDYSVVMREAALVICHGNHGTVARALAEGIPVVVTPAMPDDAEHGARVAWAGAGLMIPQPLLGASTLRSVVRRVLTDDGFATRARAIARWSTERDGAVRGADLVEHHAATRG